MIRYIMNNIKYFIVVKLLFSFCLCEINSGQKKKLLNGFKDNSLPNQVYRSEDGSLLSTQEVITSGEQFIAIPRDQPNAPCVGCASHVNPQVAGVSDLAHLGVRHLDLHEPSVKHSLETVLDVERQVQVVNGVRYVLTLSINFNHCSEVESENCASSKTCKLTILVKPWVKLANGGNYKAILANNCTEEWQYGDNGEVLPELSSDNNQIKGNTSVDPSDTTASDGDIEAKHNTNVESQPNQERSLTEEDIKKIQEQIISNTQFQETTESSKQSPLSSDASDASKQHVFKVESGNHNENSIPVTESEKPVQAFDINLDKVIGEMLYFFDYSGFKHKSEAEDVDVDTASDQEQLSSSKNNDIDYQKLANESLYEFMQSSFSHQHYEVVKVDKAIVQDISRKLIKIDFSISPTDCLFQNDGILSSPKCYIVNPKNILHCHSKILVNNWIDKKQYFVKCNIKYEQKKKTNVLKDRNPSASKYYQLADESLAKYLHDTGNPHHIIVRVEKVTTEIVAASGVLIKIDFIISQKNHSVSNNKTVRCHSEILENRWTETNAYNVSCQMKKKENLVKINTDNPKYMQIAAESLQKYIKDKPELNLVRVAFVDQVEQKGDIIKIKFIASHAEEGDGDTFCYAEVSETRESKSEIEVKCHLIGKVYRKVEITEDDPNYYKYEQLAEESLRNYMKKMNGSLYTLVSIESVTMQWDEDIRTLINFTISPIDSEHGELIQSKQCLAKILEQPWLHKKNIDVKCELEKNLYRTRRRASNFRVRRQLTFAEVTEQDPSNPEYKALAEESLRKYVADSGITQSLQVAQIEKVTTQVVSGTLTRIDFLVSGSPGSETIKCHSKVWDQPWLNSKEINISCQNHNHLRGKRQLVGGPKDQDPTKPRYKALAEESLRKYAIDSGITEPLEVLHVEKVTTQVVSGTVTRIDFLVYGSPDSETIKCHSEVWEKGSRNFKEIKVSCENDSHRGKRQAGGIADQDPKDSWYRELAEESLHKYATDWGITEPLEVEYVVGVDTSLSRGVTRRKMYFVVSRSSDSKTMKCQSQIKQDRRSFKEIKVCCENDGHRGKRQVGAPVDQDLTDPEYKALAEESLRKYVIDSGITESVEVSHVEKVTTQVVSGTLTRIDFLVAGSPDSKTMKCHSEIWEQEWRNFKEIKVSCENDGHRGKRQVAGGFVDQDPTDPYYKELAEESLRKYAIDSGITEPLEVARVVRVSMGLAAGIITHIDFLVSGSPDSKTIKCHSQVWVQGWLNFKEIKVSCENDGHRSKRQVLGGISEVDPTAPQYKALADESLRKYMIDFTITQPLEVVQVERVTTQTVAGSLTRIDFLVAGSPDSKTMKCHSEIWEQSWRNFKEIKVSCENDGRRSKRQVPGGISEVDPTAPQYKALAKESLRKYMIDFTIAQPLEVVQVERVTTQTVAGSLTRIDFLVSGSPDSKTMKCHSEIWEQSWRNFKEIKVSCENDGRRSKRQVPGGISEVDPTAPQYKALADESLRKYMIDFTITQPLEVVQVERVTTQTVAGSLTRIDFLVAGSPDSKTMKCHSEIWEQEWRNFKEIKVSCENDGHRGKRQVAGGFVDQDPTDPYYKELAEESLRKYAIDSGITEPLEVARVVRVSMGLAAGIITHIDFLVSGSPDSKTIKCHSQVWVQGWLNFKEIKVSCENDGHRSKRQVLGGISEVDPTAPQYKALADESLRKYMIDFTITQPLEVVQVERVTTQTVAGSLTRIDFLVAGSPDSKTMKCHSEIWEQEWRNFKEIKVSCENDGHRGKRQVAGGFVDQDPTDPYYKELAEESLRKYAIDSGITEPLEVARVVRVSMGLAAGIITHIDFLVSGSPDSKTIKCHSQVWVQGWLNFKEIKVSCENDGHRSKIQVLGGISEVDPTAPQYKALADESLRKYMIDFTITQPLEVVQVERVTTQTVAGSLTRIDFLVAGSPDSKTMKCHSEIWEQEWRNFKEIKVSCENDGHRGKRQVAGGFVDQDPTDPYYKELAEESLRKYAIDSGITEPLEVARVVRVSMGLAAGIITHIDFLVSGSPDSKTIKCHSQVWVQGWLNFKEIKVSCENDGHRSKRQVLGGISEVDPTAPQYKALADESLRKYMIDFTITQPLEVVQVERVTTQTVAGSLTRIDFLVAGSPDSKTMKCHSEIWEQEWRNFKEIKVSCENDGHRGKRQVAGGFVDQDPTDPYYKELAEESLRKYAIDSGITEPLEVARVVRVSMGLAAGIITHIDFLVSGSPDSKTIKCHSQVWVQGWLNFKEIKVSCENDGHRSKRQVLGGISEVDPTAPQYKALADESLRKYMIDFTITQPLEVVQVERVTTQTVAGSLTRIDFLVAGSPDSKTMKCHSEIWEQEWRNFKEIKVSCENDGHRGKRQVAGGFVDQDPTDPYYKELAEESLRKYAIDSGITEPLEVARVVRVSMGLAAGIITHIDFLVSGSPDSKTIKCHSQVWVQGWLNFKEIKVSCENDGHRSKRQVLGGISEVDPTAPQYKALADESLRKYVIDFTITQPLEVVQVERVTTQTVAGSLTRIDFLVAGSPDSKTMKCHSEIWEQSWRNFKEIKVSCENDGRRSKRQVPGGISEVDPTAPQYKALAKESLRKYMIDFTIAQPLEVVQVERVTTQTVAGSLTRIDFLVSGSPDSKTMKCHSEIWEQSWRNFKEIKVSCENDGRRSKRQVPGGISEVDPTAPQYKALADESLRKYMIDFTITQPLEVVQVERVTTQTVAGSLTRIDFLVAGSPDSKTMKCHSEIWEQEWRNFKEIKVSCENDGHRGKRQVAGGFVDQDPTDPYYKELAEESLRKYGIDSGITEPLEVARVVRVSMGLAAGIITHIDFLVSGSPDSKTIKCHSQVWVQGWLNFKEIKVSCENDGHRSKRQVLGGISEVDPTAPQYKALADESLRKYMIDFTITQPLEVVQVERVTTQTVAGSLTRIDFLVAGSPDSKRMKCHSEIWEQEWRNFKEIKVSCENDGHRGKRQVAGGFVDQDPTDPYYKELAEESLRKYAIDSGITEPLEVARVVRVSMGLAAGIITHIDFLVSGSPDSKTIKCHSQVWVQGWLNFKEIKVSCENDGHRSKIQVLGGISEVDPTAPQYKALADESLRKYMIDFTITQPLEVVQVERVTTQTVAGSLTRIDFLVAGSPDSKTMKCHSEIWEQEWRNFKEIKVSCENDGHRGKRQVAGGFVDQDPTDPYYKELAEESLRKYAIDSGITEPLEVARVVRVSMGLAAGIITHIDFLVSGSPDSKTIKCHSQVWVQGWLNFKEIKVSCENDGHRSKRQVLGGISEVDPTAPQYKALADESLRKYMIDFTITQPLEVVQVERVTTQTVAGSLTRIDFLVAGSPDSKTMKCHSEIWEQEWRNFKEIKVSCENDGHRGKRQVAGGFVDQDPTDPYYKELAEESLRKYAIDSGITEPLEVARVVRVSMGLAAGIITHIDFLVSGSPDSKTIKCHSQVWVQGWLNFKEIKVSCENDGHRSKRQVLGGISEVDPTAPQYKALADESLRKYVIDFTITQPLEVVQVERVTTQTVAGSLTRIDFLVAGSPDSKTMKCHSEIWEQEWRNFKEIKVSCENDGHRGKRQVAGGFVDQDPTDPYYKELAEESLRKYAIDSGITEPLEVARVVRVSMGLAAGIITHIDFLVSGSPDSKTIKCHSQVWVQGWLNFKEIKVSCENDGHRSKRQVLGGISEVDPTAPQYKALADESLRKYMIDFTITQPLEVVQVERVTTQTVAGSLTRIDFLVAGSPDSKTMKCHSEIWEQSWRNFKEIKVSCENDGRRSKRQVPGGISEVDPTAPQYKALAKESLRKYMIDFTIAQPLEVVQVERVTTQTVAGSLTRIDFLVAGSPDSKTMKCHSEIWEQEWRNFKEIKVSCENDGHRGKRQVAGGFVDQDPTDPYYKELAEESLRKYAIDSGITEPLEVARVVRVSIGLAAGIITHIDFLVSGSPDSKTIKCHSQVWVQGWLNFKEIKVSCENDGHRSKRQVLGGISEVDPTAPQYKALADESLRKYMIDFTITQPLEVVQVERVTTQTVAGSLTRIDFLVAGSPDSKTMKCLSEIWEQEWRNFKEIKVSCENDGHRGKRQVAGGFVDQDPTDPYYKELAEESLRKYAIDSGITEPLEVARVVRVSMGLAAGIITHIDFLVSGSLDSKTIKCHSQVWVQGWLNFKEIKVSCENDGHRSKRQVLGGISEVDPTAPQYKALADESLRKYMIDFTITQPLEVVQVERVTTQTVAGSLTRIDFLVAGSPDSKTMKCHSEIWEQEWRNFKEIKVSCENDGHRNKRQVAGGFVDQDPTDPYYKELAEESLRKYAIDSGITEPLEVARVVRVTMGLAAGIITHIDFLVSGSLDSKTIKCHSQVWVQGWLNFKEIKVSCENDGHRSKRQVLGGISEVDPTAPQYKALADESLRKYMIDFTITQPLEVVQVERVTTQTVAGSLTRIDFLVAGSPDSKTMKCHSEIWEQEWRNFKEIKVSCENDGHRGKRQVAGGFVDQDPTDPYYKELAEESLRKYAIDSGITEPLEVARVVRVSMGLAAGIITHIDFLVSGSLDSKTIKCHSQVWVQGWLNFKEIKVSCENDGHRSKFSY